jgi:predicted nucleotidyltransferase
LDVVVKTKRGTTGFDIASYEIDLENLFGVKVDVLPLNSLHPGRHGEILKDLVYLQHD